MFCFFYLFILSRFLLKQLMYDIMLILIVGHYLILDLLILFENWLEITSPACDMLLVSISIPNKVPQFVGVCN